MNTPAITKEMTMGDILNRFPSARRALFQRYHVGGCSSCGFEDTDTLDVVCKKHNVANIEEVVEHLLKSHEADTKIQISAKDSAELLKMDKAARLVDVRTQEEYNLAHIEGAILADNPEVVEQIMTWPKDTPIIVHCHHGMRSLDAASYIIGHGFTRVQSMTGGIDAWSSEVDSKVPRDRSIFFHFTLFL